MLEIVLKMLLFAEKTFKAFYNQIAQNLINVSNMLPADEIEKINKDLQREHYLVNKDTIDHLDAWCNFFYNHGSFPGSQELILVTQAHIPNFVIANTPLPPIDIFRNFTGTYAKALVSIHALAALNIYYGGSLQI